MSSVTHTLRLVPTPGERIATLEVTAREHERRIESLEDYFNGGGDVEYARSVRGRLHALEGTQAALGVVTKQRVRLLRGWHATIITVCACVTAAASIVAALHAITG